jgi:hypothetical protein
MRSRQGARLVLRPDSYAQGRRPMKLLIKPPEKQLKRLNNDFNDDFNKLSKRPKRVGVALKPLQGLLQMIEL